MIGGNELRKRKFEALLDEDVPRRKANRAVYMAAGRDSLAEYNYEARKSSYPTLKWWR